MIGEIFGRFKQEMPDFPQARRPRVGAVIREIRTNLGVRQMDFAEKVRINQSTFKSFENDHQKATTVDNLERCAKELKVSTESLILLGREYDPANFFVMKRSPEISEIEGLRKRKHTPEDWRQSIRLKIQDFDITPISPPINTKRDFFVFRAVLPPKRSMEDIELGIHKPIIAYLAEGFNIHIKYANSERTLTSGQAYAIDGYFPHTVANDDVDNSAIIYFVTKLPNDEYLKKSKRRGPSSPDPINIARGVTTLRSFVSERTRKVISLRHLADLTDFLNERQLTEIMRLKQESSVVYWEKIEDLLSAADIPMEDFLSWARGKENSYFSVANVKTRAWIEYPYCGLKICSCVPAGINNLFFCGQLFMEGAGTVVKDSWERRDKAMVSFYVEEGELQIFAGKRKKTFHLLKGESAYLDGNLGYTLRNISKTQTRLFFASYKGIQT